MLAQGVSQKDNRPQRGQNWLKRIDEINQNRCNYPRNSYLIIINFAAE